MKECWTEGDLRAYLDRELPAGDRERIAAHLAECSACGALYGEIAARAERVAAALGALAETVSPVAARPAARPVRLWPRWAAAAGIAAGLALLLLTPRAQPPAPAPVALEKGDFVALDNEPIDAGLVVRVAFGPDNLQADVIVSADGRARAYRLVKTSSTD